MSNLSSYLVANRVLDESERAKRTVSPLALIKLVYIAHGFHLAIRGTPLIAEDIVAWRYGPVIRNIYRAVKHFKKGVVPAGLFAGEDEIVPTESGEIVDAVTSVYGEYDGLRLSALTHRQGTPWHETVNNDKEGFGAIIPNGRILKHFQEKVAT